MSQLPNINRQFVMAARPVGIPKESDFAIHEAPVPVPKEGEMLVRAHYLSADPLQRYRMEATSGYGRVLQAGDPIKGRMVGQVVQSRHPDYKVGDFVEGMLGWQEYAISDGSTARAEYAPGIARVDPNLAPITTSLGLLGYPGVTAYFSIIDICRPKPGETIVITSAAGTVGSTAGQIARIFGARVVGIAGTDEKVRWLTEELGFDAGINYRTADLSAALKAACPDGIDMYYDNVGGEQSDIVMQQLVRGARVALVGDIARINSGEKPMRRDFQHLFMATRATVQGFIVYDYEDRADEARRAIGGWLTKGWMKYRETVVDGFENAPAAFIAMMQGGGIGKYLIRLVKD